MKLAYFGTPQFSADFLGKILSDSEGRAFGSEDFGGELSRTAQARRELVKVSLIVTQPDKPVGRRQIMTPSPVRLLADKYKIPVITDLSALLTTDYQLLTTCDLALVYAYGRIIPANLLAIPRHGFWNIHPSLLPKYRGASPTAYPLLNGDTTSGVTLMKMDEKMDHGPIIAQEKYDIKPNDKRPDLERELTDMGFELFKKAVLRLTSLPQDGFRVNSQPQDHDQATFTKLLKKDDGFIPLQEIRSALVEDGTQAYNKFRAFYPWPGIWTIVKTQIQPRRLKITDCALEEGKLTIKKVQFEGKNEILFNASIME